MINVDPAWVMAGVGLVGMVGSAVVVLRNGGRRAGVSAAELRAFKQTLQNLPCVRNESYLVSIGRLNTKVDEIAANQARLEKSVGEAVAATTKRMNSHVDRDSSP